MPSQLVTNDSIGFLCAKNFVYRGIAYAKGDEFDGSEANNIETLVRARFVIPVVDDLSQKPRHWHMEVKLRESVAQRLSDGPSAQIVFDTPPDSSEVVDLNTLTDPNREPEEAEEPVNPLAGPPDGYEADPNRDEPEDVVAPPPEESDEPEPESAPQPESEPVPEGKITEIKAWVGDDLARAQAALAAEEAGENRSTLIAWLKEKGA